MFATQFRWIPMARQWWQRLFRPKKLQLHLHFPLLRHWTRWGSGPPLSTKYTLSLKPCRNWSLFSTVLAFSRRPACSSLEKLPSSPERSLRSHADCLAEGGAEEIDNDVIVKLKHPFVGFSIKANFANLFKESLSLFWGHLCMTLCRQVLLKLMADLPFVGQLKPC